MEKQAYYSAPLPNPLPGGEGINQSFIGALILLLCVLLLPACSQMNISQSGSRQPDSMVVDAALSPATMQQFQAALELIALQEYQQAEMALQQLIAVHPSLAGLYLNLGMIYASTDRDELAQQEPLNLIRITRLLIMNWAFSIARAGSLKRRSCPISRH